MGELQKKKWLVIVGNDPYLPLDPEEMDRTIVVVGSAACYCARSYRRLSEEKCSFIEGEPPIPVPKWVPRYRNLSIH